MKEAYKLFVPKQAVGASLVYFDIFNAVGSGVALLVDSLLPIVSGAVAVTGVVGVDLHLQYTTAVGTGGTAATYNGTDIAAATITALAPGMSAINDNITARLTPTGGATAGALLSYASVFTEETNSAVYQGNLYEMIARNPKSRSIIVPQGFGLRVLQGAVASVGNIGFEMEFSVAPQATL